VNTILCDDVQNLLILSQIGGIDVSLPDEVTNDEEQYVKAGRLVVSELYHAIEGQVGVVVLEKTFYAEHLALHDVVRFVLVITVLLFLRQIHRILKGQHMIDLVLLDLKLLSNLAVLELLSLRVDDALDHVVKALLEE
jgi:hypothetical protein